ncbi:hypothetical protein DdX_01007 [Ditylenchus destructor]|uniref:Uncharacterized protein n=1 Tax=Ditylenchus destructor TaxID=166010 RepID=A0AAD4NJT3_9BILA|nr:hypothetical protein DdX_01007 [Ditylenchus destructor]
MTQQLYFLLLFLKCTATLLAYINDANWVLIRDGKYATPNTPFNEIVFDRHPIWQGRRLFNASLALIYQGQFVAYGQTGFSFNGQPSSDKICAKFVDQSGERAMHVCDNFRVLSNLVPNRKEFVLLKPEELMGFDEKPNSQISLVRMSTAYAVLMLNPTTQSSFFGSLKEVIKNPTYPELGVEKEAIGVDYDGSVVKYRGDWETSGQFIMFVAHYNRLLAK